jgi:excisionase family DNA binding protein
LKLELVAMPLEDTVNIFTAARMARVSPETMRRWCDHGRIPCVKLVGRWRVYKSALIAWMESKQVKPLVLNFPPQNPQNPQNV